MEKNALETILPRDTPSPEETQKAGDIALEEKSQRKRNPGARAFVAYLRDIAQRKTPSKDPSTNIIDQGDKVTYNLSDGQIARLLDALEKCRLEKSIMHMSERQGSPDRPYSGIMIDYDLDVSSETTRMTDRHCHRIAHALAGHLARTLQFEGEELVAHVGFIIKTEPVPSGKLWRYGFHILVPGVQVRKGYRKYLVKNHLLEDAQIKRVLDEMGVINKDPLDTGAVANPALFVGSCKSGKIPYEMGPVFRVIADRGGYVDLERISDSDLKQYNICAEMSLNYSASILNEHLGLGLPVLVAKKEYEPRADLAATISELDDRTLNGVIDPTSLIITDNALSLVTGTDAEARHMHAMLGLLTPDYASDYHKWIKVIFAIANTSESYRPLAEWFSQRCPEKWDAKSFDELWNDAVRKKSDRNITKRSLYFWAKECDPEGYAAANENSYFNVLMDYIHDYGGEIEHYMIAKILEIMLGNKFVVDVPRKSKSYIWYEFVTEGQNMRPGEIWKWREEAEPDEIHIYMSEKLPSVFKTALEMLNDRVENAENEEIAKYYKALAKNVRVSAKRLFNDTFKNGVIRQANKLFRSNNRGFIDDLDKDGYLFGHGRGLFRLGASVENIDYFHEHRISRYTTVCPGRFDPRNPSPEHRLVLDTFAAVIPEPDMRRWLATYMATGLYGGYKDAMMLLWEGAGQNGKTALLMSWINCLGEMYANKGPMQLLTDEKRESANSPNSAKMMLEAMRAFVYEESNETDILNPATVKEIVNPGKISGSDKHEKQKTFKMTATVAAASNYGFVILTQDHGTWRRLRRYVSKVKFVAHPDPGNPYERQEDERYAKTLTEDPLFLSAFLDILVYFYERLQLEYGGQISRVPCDTLERETEEFRNSQDAINRFISEKIVMLVDDVTPADPKEYIIPLTDVSRDYISWFGKNYDDGRRRINNPINQLQNSKLSKYIRTMPGGAQMLYNCRVLKEGEFGPRANTEQFLSQWQRGNKMEEEVLIEWIKNGQDGWWLPDEEAEPKPTKRDLIEDWMIIPEYQEERRPKADAAPAPGAEFPPLEEDLIDVLVGGYVAPASLDDIYG